MSRLGFQSDRPIATLAEDRFGFLPYADAFALLINDRETDTPLTVAVSGPWGSGKTSLAEMLVTRLKAKEYWQLDWDYPPITCWFNAWLHRDAPHLGAALAAAVAREVSRERPLRWRLLSPLPMAMLSPERRLWRRVWIGVVVAAVGLLSFMALLALVPSLRSVAGPVGALFAGWSNALLLWAAIPAAVAMLRLIFKVTDTLGAFLDEPRSVAANGSVAEVREQLGRIMSQAQRRFLRRGHRRRIVIVIDDLERCPADKALDMCEVATQLLGHPDVVTVLVADLDLVEVAAAARYSRPDLAGEQGFAAEVGQEYLHKMIQLRFNLPPLDRATIAVSLGLKESNHRAEGSQ